MLNLCAHCYRLIETLLSKTFFLISDLPVLLFPGLWPTSQTTFSLSLCLWMSLSLASCCLQMNWMTRYTDPSFAHWENFSSLLSFRATLSGAVIPSTSGWYQHRNRLAYKPGPLFVFPLLTGQQGIVYVGWGRDGKTAGVDAAGIPVNWPVPLRPT